MNAEAATTRPWTGDQPTLYRDEEGILTGPLAKELSRQFGVSTAVGAEDYTFNSLVWSHQGDIAGAFREYIAMGQDNARQVKAAFETYGGGARTPPAMLDFASGYGRVGRHMKGLMPGARYTAMDIHPAAVAFLRDRLGLDAIQSYSEPWRIVTRRRFDFIFAVSFFSHVRREHFVPWLAALHRLLAPRGVLMFTAHGEETHRTVMKDVSVDAEGYGMWETSEQFDLPVEDYVHALTYPPFVKQAIAGVPGLELVGFEPASWWTHQDMYVVRSIAPAPPVRAWDRTRHRVRRTLGAAKRALLQSGSG